MKLGFVGLGRMGASIARNLLSAGHEVCVYNRTRDKAETLKSDGARIADSPAEAAQGNEAVLSMLADDAAVEGVTFGKQGIAAGLAPGAVHISQSTISVALGRKLAQEHAQHQQTYLSAPVFGRPDAAAAKRLIVVAAGDPQAVARFQLGSSSWRQAIRKLWRAFSPYLRRSAGKHSSPVPKHGKPTR
jgi:3-hydroxyisobutyrate dehydrogenase-like beta-hydroxyacid dehydrogenase